MNIMITGADGFIGKNLSKYLSIKNTVFRINSHKKPAKKAGEISVNLRKTREVERALKEFRKKSIDVLIHLATRRTTIDDDYDDISVFKDNVKITENIIRIIQKLQIPKVVNFSSTSVYPSIDGTFDETSRIMPQENYDCLYGLSKFCSEVMLDFLLRDDRVCISHLRIPQVFGGGMPDYKIMSVMKKELKKKNSITLYGNGERISNFIEAGKLSSIIEFIIEREISGVYNIGDENISYDKLAQRTIEKYGNDHSVIKKIPEGRRDKFILDMSKFQNLKIK